MANAESPKRKNGAVFALRRGTGVPPVSPLCEWLGRQAGRLSHGGMGVPPVSLVLCRFRARLIGLFFVHSLGLADDRLVRESARATNQAFRWRLRGSGQ